MIILLKRGIFLTVAAMIFCVAVSAEVRLPNILSDHAVLQRDAPVHIWGWAAPGEKVTIHFHGQTREAIADEIGAWQAWLMPEKAGGPYILSVSGSQTRTTVERHDILMGDVWVASGQSNMEFPLKGFPTAKLKNGEQEIASASHPQIRLLHVGRAVSNFPLNDVNGAWAVCTPATAANFSAVAYFFGRDISQRENVPVGIIDSSWGGTPAQVWVSMDALGADDFTAAMRDDGIAMTAKARRENIRSNFALQNDVLVAEGKAALIPPHPLSYPETPSVLYNGMIAPLTHYTIKGVLWYQGESDSGPQRAGNYTRLLSLLITSWRNQWDEGNLPFLLAQISSSEVAQGDWFRIRDAQRRVLRLRNTEMAVTLDLGDPSTVHPPDKQSVGMRLALAALGTVYGEKIAFASPEFLEATTEGNSIRIWLTHAEGLSSRGKTVGGFEIAGRNQNFVPADAKIEDINGTPTILMSSPSVPQPQYVRYGWTNMVTSYLYNSAGLPLGTFTTE